MAVLTDHHWSDRAPGPARDAPRRPAPRRRLPARPRGRRRLLARPRLPADVPPPPARQGARRDDAAARRRARVPARCPFRTTARTASSVRSGGGRGRTSTRRSATASRSSGCCRRTRWTPRSRGCARISTAAHGSAATPVLERDELDLGFRVVVAEYAGVTALIFDLDGTLVDTGLRPRVQRGGALAERGMAIDGWRIHRRIGIAAACSRARSGARWGASSARRGARPPASTRRDLPRDAARTSAAPRRRRPAGRHCASGGVVHGIATSGRRPEIDPSLDVLGVGTRRSSSTAATSSGQSRRRTCSSNARRARRRSRTVATSSATPSGTCSRRGGRGC